ncbi:S-layer homology domain-containing protein [Anaerobacillus sp. MEB173]|uniref:S-layer homology domain-containing protein n=1 Tax=Anaerobacillus sp. MEB173 TaxID=3383345 RepID=UPI003F909E6D
MKTIKLLVTFILVALFVLPVNITATTNKTIDHYIAMDMEEDYWAFYEIDDFINADIIDGYIETVVDDEFGEYVDMTVRPENNITRAEFVKILVTALNLESNGQPKSFSDVKESNWYYSYVNIASSLDIIKGFEDGRFGANEPITRDQITAIIVRAFKETIEFPAVTATPFTDVKESHWAFEEINKAAATEIVKGTSPTTFKPKNNATRAQAIVMLHRAMNKETADLTNEQDLINFVENHIKQENTFVEVKSYVELAALYDANTTGFYQLVANDSIEMYQMMEEDGVELTISANDENMVVTALSVNTRVASIEVTDLSYTISMKDKNSSFEYTDTLDGVYNLKKDKSGNWKIYNFVPTFDEELYISSKK